MAAGTPGRPLHLGPRTYDEAKLSAMVEPIKIRIDRIKNGQRTPIPPPPNDANGDMPGWTREQIRNELETFLVNQWCGGGLYEIQATDSSENPIVLKWQPYWPPQEYPEQTPPPYAEARSMDAPPVAQTTTPNVPGARMPIYPNQQPQYAYPMPAAPPVGSPQFATWSNEMELRRLREENERRREEADKREREAREEKHRADLERERMANNQRFGQLEDKLLMMLKELKEGAAPKGPSPAEIDMQRQLAELKEESRRQSERAEAARRELEADRRETALRDQMRQMQEETKRQIEATQRQIEATQREFQALITNLTTQLTSNANRPDPMIAVLQDNARHNAEVLKEMSRESSAAMARLQAFMMNPIELMRMTRDSTEGADKAVERAMRFTDTIVSTQQKVLENALSMQPQGNGVIDAVTQGMNNVKEFFERFVTGKSREAIAQAQSQAEIARAQAHAFEVNARISNPSAFVQPPPQGLAGPTEVVQPQVVVAAPNVEPAKPMRVEGLWGRTDAEWFGTVEVLETVQRLRAGVAEFQAAIDLYEQTGKAPATTAQIPGAHPHHAAQGIRMAVAVAQQRQLVVPAIIELLMKGLEAEFMAVLLPQASIKYREAVLAELHKEDEAGPGDDDDDEDEDEDEDEDASGSAESAQDGVAPEAVVVANVTDAQPIGSSRGRRRQRN